MEITKNLLCTKYHPEARSSTPTERIPEPQGVQVPGAADPEGGGQKEETHFLPCASLLSFIPLPVFRLVGYASLSQSGEVPAGTQEAQGSPSVLDLDSEAGP